MLAVVMKIEEFIRIGDALVRLEFAPGRDRVKLCIEAPRQVSIERFDHRGYPLKPGADRSKPDPVVAAFLQKTDQEAVARMRYALQGFAEAEAKAKATPEPTELTEKAQVPA